MKYPYGKKEKISQNYSTPGINQQIIKNISQSNKEPSWLLEWRLASYANYLNMPYPSWSNLSYNPIDNSKIIFHSYVTENSKQKIKNIYKKLGVPVDNKSIALDMVLDSRSVHVSYSKHLSDLGIIFTSISDAIRKHPDLVKKYLGSVVSNKDNYFACLNSSVFSDGSFVYIPANTICPIELSTYFRINSPSIGQFERTLIIAEKNSYVSYLEGCTAIADTSTQLHAAVVEIVCLDNAHVKYSTIQNWYPGNKKGQGGVYNFVTKRGIAYKNSKICWIQVETGSAITWKYPSIILKGDNSIGEFQSVTFANNKQQADTGTKIWHIGNKTKSFINSKSISAGSSKNSYRSLVDIKKNAQYCTNFTNCDSLIIGRKASANTIPTIRCNNIFSQVSHEASTSFINKLKIFYLNQRGLNYDKSCALIVNGLIRSVITNLPLEFAVEAKQLMEKVLYNATG